MPVDMDIRSIFVLEEKEYADDERRISETAQ
jgi:hypothetical protein